MSPKSLYCIFAAMALLFAGCSSQPESAKKGPYDTDPLEPAAAMASFHIVDGFRLEQFAAEPNVVDPVEMCWDENGGIYVAEMLDYPFDPPEGEDPKSRIRYLEDTDGDGVIDKSTIFADKLLQVTSVLPWKGGILATAAPDILYLKDTDGDHKADVREVMFTGFQSREVSPESRITNLRWGIDNWVYAANNGRPGVIVSPQAPGKPGVVIRGYDFRFKPGQNLWEPAAGPTQFGMSFDEWGNRYMSQNTIHLRQAVLPALYIMRNPYYSPDSMLQYLPQDDASNSVVYPLTQPQEWRKERTEVRQERYSETSPGRIERVGGHFTAATGVTAYVGDAFPAEFKNNIFLGDANGSLVHRDILTPKGVTFTAERWPADKEFLASTDVWFRPVNFANAPDGNLYVMDYYREYIEEPASIPKAIQERLQLNFYRGNDRGRIYRIVPVNGKGKGSLKPGLGNASVAELVAALEHPNGWYRRTAQRLLVERQAQDAVPALKKMAVESASPLGRLHALWTLEGLGALDAELVRKAMGDEHPGVRAHAVRLAEGFLPKLADAVAVRSGDSDPKVRFQVALTLGGIPGSHKLLAKMAAAESDDPWMRAALLTSAGNSALPILTRLLIGHKDFFSNPTDGRKELIKQLSLMVGAARRTNDITMFLITLDGSPQMKEAAWRAAALDGLAGGLAIAGTRHLRLPTAKFALTNMLSDPAPEVRRALREAAQFIDLPALIVRSKTESLDDDLAIDERVLAVRSLRGGHFADVSPVLGKILTSPAPQKVQAEAAHTLSVFSEKEVPAMLLSGWKGYGPEARRAAVAALLEFRERAAALLDAIEQGQVEVASIDPVDRIRLAQFPAPDIQDRAKKLFEEQTSDREKVVADFQDVLKLTPNEGHGKQVFEDHCAKCHLRRGERGRIGPDLSGVNNKTSAELLTHILDPSFEIQPNYTNYLVVDNLGRMYDGLLVGETESTVKLRGELEDVTIPRKSITEMRASNVSLMPDGLENEMNRQDLADVIAYLRAGL